MICNMEIYNDCCDDCHDSVMDLLMENGMGAQEAIDFLNSEAKRIRKARKSGT